MKKTVTIFLLFSGLLFGQNIWLNEIHYDNSGADTGEFVEVVLENAGSYVLSDFTITLYNGNGGGTYGTHTLDTFTQGVTENGFTIYSKLISGIQNGDPDGVCIDYQGTVISGQFLSYEGTFTATNGPANGMTSTDIGVSETPSSPVGESLQLLGSGTSYADFTWSGPHTATQGLTNSDGAGSDQTLPVELTSFTAVAGDGQVTLKWATASELNNEGFSIERRVGDSGSFEEIDSYETNTQLDGAGTSSTARNYSWTDNAVVNGLTYWYKLVDVDVDGVRTEHGPISAKPYAIETPDDASVPHAFTLNNYPNPFNPETRIVFDLTSFENNLVDVKITVHDILGREVITLYDGQLSNTVHSFITWDGTDANHKQVPSGVYFYTFISPQRQQTNKMLLMR